MRAPLLYRIASVLFVLFALGHTLGFLTFKPPTAGGLAVRDAMNNVQFRMDGATLSYGGFYAGFGLFISAYLLFSACLAWHLSGLANRLPQAIGNLGWAFFALQLICLAIAYIYFAAPQVVFSALAAICVGAARWRTPLIRSARP